MPAIPNTNSYLTAAVVTPSDTVDLPFAATGLLVTVAGNLSFLTTDNVIVNMTAAPVMVIPVMVKRVRSTGTTATVVALY